MGLTEQDLAGVMLSFWAGAATGLGAIFAVLLTDACARRDRGVHAALAFSLALAAGVMISVSIVDLWLPLAKKDGIFFPSCAVLLGAICFKLLSYLLAKYPSSSLPHHPPPVLLPIKNNEVGSGLKLSAHSRERNFKLALTMFLTLTLHNIPEGLAVSVSNSASEKLGVRIALAIAFHNFPEGVAIAVPYYAATGRKMGAIGLAFLSGLSEPLGALISVLFLGPFFRANPSYMPYSLCIVGGIMLSSALLELLPESKSHGRLDLLLFGLVLGTATMLITIWATE